MTIFQPLINFVSNKRYQVLAVLGIFSIITYLDRTAMGLTGDAVTKDLGLTDTQFGWVLFAFTFAYGAFDIPTGWLGDKYGPKSTLIRIVVVWSIFTILTGFSTGFLMLFIVRFLFGAGEAGAYPNATVAISRWFPTYERGRAQSIVWMCSRMGGALAPFFILPIMNTYDWRTVFYVFGVIGLIWAICWYLFFRDEPRDMPNIKPEEVKLIEENRSVKSVSHGTLPWKVILKNRNLWALCGMYYFLLYGAYFYMSWMPKYLSKGRGIPKEELTYMTSLPFIMGIFGCLIGGFASDYLVKKWGLQWGRRSVGMAGLILSGIAILIATNIKDNSTAIIFLSLGLAFKDFTLPVAWSVATDIGGSRAGTIAGTMGMCGHIGSSMMSVGFGYVLAGTGSWEIPTQMIGCLVIVGGLLWFKIDASKPLIME
jgi:MFS transporter, ACS family, glucarate transporter